MEISVGDSEVNELYKMQSGAVQVTSHIPVELTAYTPLNVTAQVPADITTDIPGLQPQQLNGVATSLHPAVDPQQFSHNTDILTDRHALQQVYSVSAQHDMLAFQLTSTPASQTTVLQKSACQPSEDAVVKVEPSECGPELINPEQCTSSARNTLADHTDSAIIVTDSDVLLLWQTIGEWTRLMSDAAIARFLLSLYFNPRREGEENQCSRCVHCSSPLTMCCVTCLMSSRQPALSSAPPSQLQLPTSGDSSQDEHGTVPQECPSPGSDMDMGYGYDDSSEEDAVTEHDGAVAEDVSLEAQIRKQWGITTTPEVVLRRCDSVSTASQADDVSLEAQIRKQSGIITTPLVVLRRFDSVSTASQAGNSNTSSSPTLVKAKRGGESGRPPLVKTRLSKTASVKTDGHFQDRECIAKTDGDFQKDEDSVASTYKQKEAICKRVTRYTRCGMTDLETAADNAKDSPTAVKSLTNNFSISCGTRSTRLRSAVAEFVAKNTRTTSAVAEFVAKSTRVTSESVKLVVDDRSLEHSADEIDSDCTGEIVTKNPQKTPESNNRDEDWNPEHHSLATEDHKRRSGKNTRLASTGRKPVIHDGSKEHSADEGDADSTEKIAVKNRCKKPTSDDSDEDWVPKKHKHATDDCRKSVGENTRVTFADDKSALNKRSMEHSDNEADSDCSEEIPAKQQRKKKSEENDSDEDWIPNDHATDDDDGVSDGEFSEPQQIRLNSYVQEFSIEEFMTGKVPILIGHTGGPTSPTAHYKYYSHYTCEKCYKVFVSKEDYQSHVEDHKQEGKDHSKPERTGPDPESLQILEEIKERLVFCCPHCSRAFTSKIHHRLHVRTHNYTANSDGSYSCNFCGRSFSQETLVYCHQKGRKGRTSVCTKCGINLASRCQIRAHMKTHKEGTGRSHCKICGEAFDGLRKVEINRHMRSHESGNVVCSVCGKSLKRSSLTNHMLTHSNTTPHTCSVCNKSFRHKASLEHHQTLHGEKTIQCEICGMYFRRMALLKKHKAYRHQGEGVKCQHCGKILCDKSHLNHHIRVIHKKIKPFVCSVCGVALAYKDHLISHMRIHTGEKPYQCPHCPSMFARKDYLKLHIRTHTGEKPYRCQDCGQRFICRSSLTLHRKTHHKDKTFPCSVCGEEFPLQSSVDYHCHLKHGATYTFLKDCWQPAENPVASQDCGQPAENPVASQDCGQPAENPVASQDCRQPAENPVASQDCGQPAENPVASQDCGQPAENPVASQDCGQPAENSAASQDCGQPAENRAAPGYCVLPTENWVTPRDCVLPTENWATPRDCVLPTENWATQRDCVLPAENPVASGDCVLPAENPVASGDCVLPAENPVASGDCVLPAEIPVASRDCVLPAENPVASGDCVLPAENLVA